MTTGTLNRTTRALLAGAFVALVAQAAHAQDDCGTRMTPNEAAALAQQEAAGAYVLPAMPERHIFNVPMTIHIVRAANASGGISVAEVDASLVDVNNQWQAGGILFFRTGSVDFINNDDFYYNVDSDAEIDQMTGTNSVPNTINVYFTANLRGDDGPDPGNAPDGLCGRGSFTTSPVQGVAMDITCTHDDGNTSTLAHELGHFLDLYHTHETVFGLECPNGSNCGSAGDLVCDTAADPNVTGQLTGCSYNGVTARCGQGFTPDPTNLMSYGGGCRTHFTEGQRQRALGTLVNLRPNLISGGALFVTWVDFNYTGPINGSFYQPFKDVWTATHWVAPNGTVVIKSGVNNQVATYDIPCTIDTFRGWAIVGQQ